jgi:hypothetical protein
MHDDRRWLRHPVLPRPPAVPYFGPELRALVGLDFEEFEPESLSSDPGPDYGASEEPAADVDTQPEALESGAAAAGQSVANSKVIRTGT